jgi:hypothetical protein
MDPADRASTSPQGIDETRFKKADAEAEPRCAVTESEGISESDRTILMNAMSEGSVNVKLVVGGSRRSRGLGRSR